MIEDWSVLKYGWLAVFLLHVAFLGIGVYNIKAALEMFDPELIRVEQRRLDYVIQAIYMVTIAFSIILLILAVFVLEIFRNQRRLMHQMDQILANQTPTPSTSGSGSSTAPRAPSGPPAPGSE